VFSDDQKDRLKRPGQTVLRQVKIYLLLIPYMVNAFGYKNRDTFTQAPYMVPDHKDTMRSHREDSYPFFISVKSPGFSN
jgi:hypothetical protein